MTYRKSWWEEREGEGGGEGSRGLVNSGGRGGGHTSKYSSQVIFIEKCKLLIMEASIKLCILKK